MASANTSERNGRQVRASAPVGPLPHSAFPERLAEAAGRMAVAFTGIEGRVTELLADLGGSQSEEQTLSHQLAQIDAAMQTAIAGKAERERLQLLVSSIRNASRVRNAIMRPSSRASEKGAGEAALYSARRDESVRADADNLAALTDWMYCILDALDRRHYGAANWQEDLASYQPRFELGLAG